MFRTDLALESSECLLRENIDYKKNVVSIDDIKITEIEILNELTSKKIGKEIGKYITIELSNLTDNYKDIKSKVKHISEKIKIFLPKDGLIFVVGLGNSNITPDALGPKTINLVLTTRHITGEISRSTGLNKLRQVAAIAPGVLGQTGIEVNEIVFSIAKKIKPSAIILIDALAAKETSRLAKTIQISNTGISPGSGVGNSRHPINKKLAGIPVISIGVPTVIDASTLAYNIFSNYNIKNSLIERNINNESLIVTPREIDLLIERASKLIAMSINCALHENFSFDDLIELTS